MDSWLTQITFWHWWALAIALGILDVLVGANFVLVWTGLSALIVGALLWVWPSMTWEIQFLFFAIGVLASLVAWHRVIKKTATPSDKPYLNQRGQHYLNREFTLQTPIINGWGKIRVDDSTWRIKGEDLPAGAKIRIVNVDGAVLIVEKVS